MPIKNQTWTKLLLINIILKYIVVLKFKIKFIHFIILIETLILLLFYLNNFIVQVRFFQRAIYFFVCLCEIFLIIFIFS